MLRVDKPYRFHDPFVLKIWKPHTHGTLRVCPGMYRNCCPVCLQYIKMTCLAMLKKREFSASLAHYRTRVLTCSGGGSTGLDVVDCLTAVPRLPIRGEGPLWPRVFRSDIFPLPAATAGAAGTGAGSTSSS